VARRCSTVAFRPALTGFYGTGCYRPQEMQFSDKEEVPGSSPGSPTPQIDLQFGYFPGCRGDRSRGSPSRFRVHQGCTRSRTGLRGNARYPLVIGWLDLRCQLERRGATVPAVPLWEGAPHDGATATIRPFRVDDDVIHAESWSSSDEAAYALEASEWDRFGLLVERPLAFCEATWTVEDHSAVIAGSRGSGRSGETVR
jgi:hypothetical protein